METVHDAAPGDLPPAHRASGGSPVVSAAGAASGSRATRGADEGRHGGEVADLVRRATLGDPSAWEAIVARYVSLVWAVALQHGIGSSDAADVAQSTWVRLLEHIQDIRDPERLGAWLATTARRESLRVVEMRRRVVLEGDDGAFDGPDRLLPPTDERLLAEERGQHVRDALDTLPPAWQSLVRLLMADPPMSYQQIGDELGLPVGSIGPTRGRCMTRMRASLDLA
jgi:RNA polymerase sigma factor (sigma-70 family)